MREILFRGKEISNGKWLYGRLGYNRLGDTMKVNDNNFFEEIFIVSDTIGQYTGLTDKTGKKIFEGDIVAGAVRWLESPQNGVVTFRDGSFGLVWYRGEIEQFNPFTSMCNVEYEVIGNIHDNPELLKGGVQE